MDNQGASEADLSALCKDWAKEFPFAKKLNSSARKTPFKNPKTA
jgi:putative transposase